MFKNKCWLVSYAYENENGRIMAAHTIFKGDLYEFIAENKIKYCNKEFTVLFIYKIPKSSYKQYLKHLDYFQRKDSHLRRFSF